MQKPVFSIVTSIYNHEKFIPDAIESVLSQAGNFFIDYQIIDGASTDGTMEVVRAYEQRLKDNCDVKQVEGVSYYVSRSRDYEFCRCLGVSYRYLSEPDSGMYDGINKGIKTAFGDIVAYINGDDYYLPYAFQVVTEAFMATPDLGLIYGESLQAREDKTIIGRYPVKDVYQNDLSLENLIDQPAAFINHEAIKEHGLFNQNMPNSSDYEMWMRLFYAEEKFLKIPSVLSVSRLYSDTKSNSNRRAIHLETLAIAKHYTDKIDISKRVEFLMGLSFLGKASWFKVRVLTAARKWMLKKLAQIYVFFSKKQIEEAEVKIFSVRID